MTAWIPSLASGTVGELTAADWLVSAALLVIVLQHGGTAGILSAMGRDGMLDHRRAELLGAIRGTLTLAALMTPVLLVWAVDAFSSPDRLDTYLAANRAMVAVYGPVTVIAFVSFVVSRVTPWSVRSNLNSVVLGTLELLRPWIAALGMAAAAIATADVNVAVIGGLAVAAGLAVGRVTRRWFYARPVRLEDLGRAPSGLV